MIADYSRLIRENIHFDTPKGNLLPQDLWGLKIAQLKELAKKYHAEIKKQETDTLGDLDAEIQSLISEPQNSELELLQLKFAVVIDILKTKAQENDNQKLEAEKRAKLNQLTDILARKQQADLEAKSTEEIQQMIQSVKNS